MTKPGKDAEDVADLALRVMRLSHPEIIRAITAYVEGKVLNGNKRLLETIELLYAAIRWRDDRLAALRVENAELNASAAIHLDCAIRANQLWAKAHPETPLMLPDGADQIVWLMEQNAELTRKCQDLCEKYGNALVTIHDRDNDKNFWRHCIDT
jgi:hypothetical protein